MINGGSFRAGVRRELKQPDLFGQSPGERKSWKPGDPEDYRDLLDHDDIDIDSLYELSARACSAIESAQMNEDLSKADLDYYARKILAAAREAEFRSGSSYHQDKSGAEARFAAQCAGRAAAERAAFDRGNPRVRKVLCAAYRVDGEIHRLKGLLRFNPQAGGLYLARCAPDNFILPAFAEHFTLRFGETSWAIIDEKRNLALVRYAGSQPILGNLSAFPFLSDPNPPGDDWEDLWRSYYRVISIENRKNPALQLQFMPRRYWKYLPEIRTGHENSLD